MSWPGERQRHSMSARGVVTRQIQAARDEHMDDPVFLVKNYVALELANELDDGSVSISVSQDQRIRAEELWEQMLPEQQSIAQQQITDVLTNPNTTYSSGAPYIRDFPFAKGYTAPDVQSILHVSQVTKSKGVFTARQGFFYRHGRNEEELAQKIQDRFPNAEIIDMGEVYKAFKGGASVAKQSHFWVKFKLPDEVKSTKGIRGLKGTVQSVGNRSVYIQDVQGRMHKFPVKPENAKMWAKSMNKTVVVDYDEQAEKLNAVFKFN